MTETLPPAEPDTVPDPDETPPPLEPSVTNPDADGTDAVPA